MRKVFTWLLSGAVLLTLASALSTGAPGLAPVAAPARAIAAAPTTATVTAESDISTAPLPPGWEPWEIERNVPGMVVRRVRTKDKLVAITIDDVQTENTTQTLGALGAAGMKATLFVIASRTDKSSVQAIVASGNELGSHSWQHRRLSELTDQEAQTQIRLASVSLWRKGGVWPTWFRAPFQDYGDSRGAVTDNGLLIAGVSNNPHDYLDESAKTITRRVMKRLRAGDVVLLHATPQTMKALPMIDRELTKKGFVAVTMTELVRDRPGATSRKGKPRKAK